MSKLAYLTPWVAVKLALVVELGLLAYALCYGQQH